MSLVTIEDYFTDSGSYGDYYDPDLEANKDEPKHKSNNDTNM